MRVVCLVAALLACLSLAAATNETAVTKMPATNEVRRVEAPKQKNDKAKHQCEAITLSGNRCKRNAVQGGHYCRQHEAIMRKREKESGK